MDDQQTHDNKVGVICDPDHDVFRVVAEKLQAQGFDVVFFEPGNRIHGDSIDELALLANKKVDPESFRALRYATQARTPTWNGYSTAVLGVRPVGMLALRGAGFETPATSFEKPEDDYVAKSLVDWHFEGDPELNGEGDVYQEYLPTAPVDFKYYGVDDGTSIDVTVLRSTSKLHGEKEVLDQTTPDPPLARKLRRLMQMVGAQAIGVDIIHSRGQAYAVDVNPAMSFRHTGLEATLAESMAARIGRFTTHAHREQVSADRF